MRDPIGYVNRRMPFSLGSKLVDHEDIMRPVTVTLQEDQRQVILLALAHLAVERPGWEPYLSSVAMIMDVPLDDKPQMFTQFWQIRHDIVRDSLPDNPTPETLNKALAKYDEQSKH